MGTIEKIVIINGEPTAGKDQTVTFINDYLYKKTNKYQVGNISTSSTAKSIAMDKYKWDGQDKSPRWRKVLSDLVDVGWLVDEPMLHIEDIIESTENNTTMVSTLIDMEFEWFGTDTRVMFIHCREPEFIDRIREYFGDITSTLFIKKEGVVNVEYTNHADANVNNYDYDYYITAKAGDLDDLNKKAIEYINTLLNIIS